MEYRKTHILVKFLVILTAELSVLYLINLLSMYLRYSPGIVLSYLTAGGLIAYAVSIFYDRAVLKKTLGEEICGDRAVVTSSRRVAYEDYPVSKEETRVNKQIEDDTEQSKRDRG